MNPELHEPICQQVAWKNAEVQGFSVALVRHGVELTRSGATEFSTDIVPDAERGAGTGIAGSVVELLKNAGVIEPVGITQAGEWYPKRVLSTRAGRKSSYVCVYRLRSLNTAAKFLERNGALTQVELI